MGQDSEAIQHFRCARAKDLSANSVVIDPVYRYLSLRFWSSASLPRQCAVVGVVRGRKYLTPCTLDVSIFVTMANYDAYSLSNLTDVTR